jgi:hypothetical protein
MRARRRQPRLESIEAHQPVGLDGIPAIERRTDITRASASLSDRDRQLAALLADHSPAEASRALRIARSTVYEGIGRIRVAFAAAGLAPRGAVR